MIHIRYCSETIPGHESLGTASFLQIHASSLAAIGRIEKFGSPYNLALYSRELLGVSQCAATLRVMFPSLMSMATPSISLPSMTPWPASELACARVAASISPRSTSTIWSSCARNSAFRAAYARMNFVSAPTARRSRALARQEAPMRPARHRGGPAGSAVPHGARATRSRWLCSARPGKASMRRRRRLRAIAPGLDVAFVASPAFGFDPFSSDADAFGAAIAASGARLCFVCLGAPKQEIFADRMAQAHRRDRLRQRGRGGGFPVRRAGPGAAIRPGRRHGMGLAPCERAAPHGGALCPMRGFAVGAWRQAGPRLDGRQQPAGAGRLA